MLLSLTGCRDQIMTDFKNFVGAAKRLDAIDYPKLAFQISIGQDELQAVTDVECRSSGFDSHNRPAMLFEPHIFYHQLSGDAQSRAVAAGLAYQTWGEKAYPADSYPVLVQAIAIDETAALKSASWGLGQVLGMNYLSAGFMTPQDMVLAFMDDEEKQLQGMVNFILTEHLNDELRSHNWAAFARAYNGPGYAKQGYDNKLAAAYANRAAQADTAWRPDRPDTIPPDGPVLRNVQTRLRDLGYVEAGNPDGKWGTKTRAAILAFRADHGLPIYVGLDDQFMAAIMSSGQRDIAPERANATVADLRDAGSRTIAHADKTNGAAAVLGLSGGGMAVMQTVGAVQGHVEQVTGLLSSFQPLIETAKSIGPWVLVGLAAFIIFEQVKIYRARLDDHQTGKNAGPGA